MNRTVVLFLAFGVVGCGPSYDGSPDASAGVFYMALR
jgi:hypothetical protein